MTFDQFTGMPFEIKKGDHLSFEVPSCKLLSVNGIPIEYVPFILIDDMTAGAAQAVDTRTGDMIKVHSRPLPGWGKHGDQGEAVLWDGELFVVRVVPRQRVTILDDDWNEADPADIPSWRP